MERVLENAGILMTYFKFRELLSTTKYMLTLYFIWSKAKQMTTKKFSTTLNNFLKSNLYTGEYHPYPIAHGDGSLRQI